MRRALLSLPAVLACIVVLASAADRSGPRCRDGSTPTFTGHPFIPWTCPGDPKPGLAPGQEPEARFELPKLHAKGQNSLDGLYGGWGGIVYYRGRRYEVHGRLRSGWRGFSFEWSSMDYYTHDRRDYRGAASKQLFAPGRYAGRVALSPFPSLPFHAWIGAPSTSTAAGLDREVILQADGRPDTHVLFLGLASPDRLRFQYVYDEPGAARARAAGELSRER